MTKQKYIDIQVQCPYDPSKVIPEKVQIHMVENQGRWIPLPCVGCDNLNGSSICQQCCTEITCLFFNEPDRSPNKIVYPQIKGKDQ